MPKTVALVPMPTKIAEIQSAYSRAAQRIVDILSNLDPATFTSVDHGTALQKVQGIILTLNDQVRMWAPGAIKAAYNESAAIARTRLEMIGAKRLPEWKYNPARHDKKIEALTKTMMADYFKANLTIAKTAKKFLGVMAMAAAGMVKVAAQVQEFDSGEVRDFIGRTVRSALAAKTKYNAGQAHLTSQDIAAKIRAKLLDQISGENFIVINDRNYSLRSYSELVARTRMRESQTEAVKESMKQFDEDLVEIPRHDNPCAEICAEYQGKVYSISGGTPGYPLLPDGGPPWH